MPRANPLFTTPALALAIALSAVVACGDPPSPRGDRALPEAASPDSAQNISGRVYERWLVFTASDSGEGSTLVAPFFFTARTVPDGVERSVRGWLNRDDAWEVVVRERWSTPPSRAPWRILPRGPLRLVVGQQDAVQTLIYGAGSRTLELEPGASLVEWNGSRGETFLLQEASLSIAGQGIRGVLLDLGRARRREDPLPGDWALLVSGDSLHVVLSSPREGPDDQAGPSEGFGRLDLREIQWPEVSVDWSETRAFEPARRGVPTGWRVSTPEGDLEGALESVSAELEAGELDGPVLPVDGLFVVRGTLQVLGADYPVTGLVRHQRN